MAVRLEVKVILPGPMNATVFKRAIRKELERAAGEVERELLALTSTWSEKNRPTFKTESGTGPKSIGGEIVAFDGEEYAALTTESTPYVYVMGGTSVRRRKLSKPYIRRSYPNSLRTGPGGIGHGVGKPRYAFPGIEARRHPELVAEKKSTGGYARGLVRAIQNAARRLFGRERIVG